MTENDGATSLTHATHNSFMVHWPASSFSMILMEKGEAGQFKGKTEDEINLNSEENLMDTANYVENETNEITHIENVQVDFETDLPTRNLILCFLSYKNKRHLERWTEEQKNTVKSHFEKHITSKKPTKKSE
ncbi:hypothetical protein WA026_013785 [Henosepilachna vigintioctopunctata]|uniref:Uncharacterized protein n=1 Tax=Henosepilachna vigintioctopunctata TaxID=420089 RepID=A0AAW1TH85_9CUCU